MVIRASQSNGSNSDKDKSMHGRVRYLLYSLAATVCVSTVVPPTPSAQAAQAPSCIGDCKFSECIDAEIARATAMKNMYEGVGKTAKSLDEYKKLTDTQGDAILLQQQEAIKDQPHCQPKFPDLTNYVNQREWNSLGWGYAFDGDKLSVIYPVNTDPATCTFKQKQLNKLKEMLSCLEIPQATEAHEQDHVNRCNTKKPVTPKEMADYEVAGYKVEIEKLKATAKELEKKCKEPVAPPVARKKPVIDTYGNSRTQPERVSRAVNRVADYVLSIRIPAR